MGKAVSFFIFAILLLMMMTQFSLLDKIVNQVDKENTEYIIVGS